MRSLFRFFDCSEAVKQTSQEHLEFLLDQVMKQKFQVGKQASYQYFQAGKNNEARQYLHALYDLLIACMQGSPSTDAVLSKIEEHCEKIWDKNNNASVFAAVDALKNNLHLQEKNEIPCWAQYISFK